MTNDMEPLPYSQRRSKPHPLRLSAAHEKVSKGVPVMCCHPASGGASTRLERGSTPSTPMRKRSDSRRMSVKKFFRVTPHEAAIIAARASDAGLEKSSYLRVQVFGQSKVRKAQRIRADWDELRRCMSVINKAGNVVNQLVVELRRMGRSSGLAHEALRELIAAARAIMTALGRR